MSVEPVILWFRNDLRLRDHAALNAAVRTGAPVIPVYILDDVSPGRWALGGASRWWLAKSLEVLAQDLKLRGASLILRRGATRRELPEIVEETGATAVFLSRGYEPWAVALEDELNSTFGSVGISFRRFCGRLLREPEDVRAASGKGYKVYTPFWRALSEGFQPVKPIAAPERLSSPARRLKSDHLADWGLLPTTPDWACGLGEAWQPGEAGAHVRLAAFLKTALKTYAEDRNRPDKVGTSRLSPHLAFGEISPAACWRAATAAAAKNMGGDLGLETFLKEIAWREFSYSLLFHWPDLPERPFREEFGAFPWSTSTKHLKAWQRGNTGYPIVDAGMRELWATGYMHNRVRMIAASFLTKHLLIPWQHGEAWFWDTLVDADLANNSASWQWVAGSGADAAPYFRIFNPVLQGEKFDPAGTYVRRWVPELARLPNTVIHAPWTAGAETLAEAGVVLGRSYPQPIVDHGEARQRALAAYEQVKVSSAR